MGMSEVLDTLNPRPGSCLGILNRHVSVVPSRVMRYAPGGLRSFSNADQSGPDLRLKGHYASQVVRSDLVASEVCVSDCDDEPVICWVISELAAERQEIRKRLYLHQIWRSRALTSRWPRLLTW